MGIIVEKHICFSANEKKHLAFEVSFLAHFLIPLGQFLDRMLNPFDIYYEKLLKKPCQDLVIQF